VLGSGMDSGKSRGGDLGGFGSRSVKQSGRELQRNAGELKLVGGVT